MENFGEKIGRETFLCLVGWGKRKINFGAQIFFPQTHQKVLSPKWRENWEGEAHENTLTLEIWNSPPSLQHVGFLSLSF